MEEDDDEDGWVFDTVKAGTIVKQKNTEKKRNETRASFDCLDQPRQMMENIDLTDSHHPLQPLPNSTVRRTSAAAESPSTRRANTKRRSSGGVKQPLGLNLTFGNSPSTVRQFRRTSDKVPEENLDSFKFPPGIDENTASKTLFSEPNSKEASLGRKAYNKAIGISCQEVLANTSDQEKREAVSRLAEAWSDLEMIDPEGLYHIVKSTNEKLQRCVRS